MNPQILEALRQLQAAMEQAVAEANVNNLAMMMLLEEKGIITAEEYAAARPRASAEIDQMRAQARAELLAAEMERRRKT